MSLFSFLFPRSRSPKPVGRPKPGGHTVLGRVVPGSTSASLVPRCRICGRPAWGGAVTPWGVWCREHSDEG